LNELKMNCKIGSVVEVIGKDVVGKVAYIGTTQFAAGKWIGLVLDDPKGKNDGSVQGKSYFTCEENHGMFVRQSQIKILSSPDSNPSSPRNPPSREGSSLRREGSNLRTPSRQKSDLSTPSRQKSDLTKSSTRQPSDLAKSTPARIKETPSSGTPYEGDTPSLTGSSKLMQPRSRLPLPGAGRQPSFTNLSRKSLEKDSTPKPDKQSLQSFQRERSFVETNFVQTPKTSNVTQILPTSASGGGVSGSTSSGSGSPALSTVILSEKMEEKIAVIQLQQEITGYKDELRDISEKLETLKIKRAQDKEKMKDHEKLKMQNEQLQEFKVRIMEAQSSLQKEIQKARHEAKEATEARDAHAEEMADLSETVEMATLDKEMAEEKAETLQLELDAATEKVEELTLDLEIIKAEMGNEDKDPGSVTQFELKQFQAQNEKLRETLVSMRDLSAHEKHELGKLSKEVEEKSKELTETLAIKEKLAKQLEECQQTLDDLQEQVDAALGAEEMVENLTTKTLDLEDRCNALMEEKADLEALHDINEEMQENARELELELREEIDMAQAKMRDITRDKDAAHEIILDHENTINKFRAFVTQVQEQNKDLREQLEKETQKPVVGQVTPEMMDFKKMFSETKAHAKAIDVELKRSELKEAMNHVHYLTSYMGDHFTARGGDADAINVLLLIPRLDGKSSILLSQIREKFGPPAAVDANSVLKGHSVDRYIFGTRVIHLLHLLQKSLHQFQAALNTCAVDTFLRVGTLYPEMSVYEKGVEFYIDLLQRDQLDENVPVTNLEKSVSYFETVYPVHLCDQKTDCPSFMADHARLLAAGLDYVAIEVKRIKVLMDAKGESSEVGLLLKEVDNQTKELESYVKIFKRRLQQEGTAGPIKFPESVASHFTSSAISLSIVLKVLSTFGRSTLVLATSNPDMGVPPAKIQEALHAAVDSVTEFGDQGIQFLTNALGSVQAKMAAISTAVHNGEYDFDGTKPEAMVPPFVLRAEEVKAEIRDATQLKYKIESKDLDMKEMRKLLKTKQEELSEMQVRKDMLEKKLSDSSKDSELMIEKLQRKLDDAHNLLRRKEKEFEETMDHLQADIDSLESERGELKDKMKHMSKKALIEGLTKSQALSASGPTSLGPSVPSPIRDSPLLVQQVQEMRTAMASLQQSVSHVKAGNIQERMNKLKPLYVPAKTIKESSEKEKCDVSKDAVDDVGVLVKKSNKLRAELHNLLSSQMVVDITRTKGGGHASNQQEPLARKLREEVARKEADQLQLEVLKLLSARKPVHRVNSDFGTFASPAFARSLKEKDYCMFGRVRFPGEVKPTDATIPILTDLAGLQEIHTKIMP